MKTRMQEGIENSHRRQRNRALEDQADALHRRAAAEERSAKALERIARSLADLTRRVDALESNPRIGAPVIPSHEAAQRHHELVGSRIEDVRVDGGLVYLEITHRGTDDEACTVLVRAAETEWLYPREQNTGSERDK